VRLRVIATSQEERLRYGSDVICQHSKRSIRIEISVDESNRHCVAKIFHASRYALQRKRVTSQCSLPISRLLELTKFKAYTVLIVRYGAAAMWRNPHRLCQFAVRRHEDAIFESVFLNEICFRQSLQERAVPEGLLLKYVMILECRAIGWHA